MGFMDKAKKMAEQAQAKLDEAQKQFNAGQGGASPSGPAVEYDEHGRPITPAAPPAPDPGGSHPPGGAAGEQGWAPQSAAPGEDVWTPPAPADPPSSAPARAGSQGVPEDRNNPSYEPPALTSGDPLAG